jgi:hypothetical protein
MVKKEEKKNEPNFGRWTRFCWSPDWLDCEERLDGLGEGILRRMGIDEEEFPPPPPRSPPGGYKVEEAIDEEADGCC